MNLMDICEKSKSAKLYGDFLGTLIKREPVAWARYGDGEFRAIYHHVGKNASGHTFFPKMGDRLREILLSKPPYLVGLQRNAVRFFGSDIKKDFPRVKWTSSEFVHDMSQEMGLEDLFRILKNRDVVVIGPEYLEKLRTIFAFEHIEIPLINCWLEHHVVLEMCKDAMRPERVFVFVAAMLSNILIDELYHLDKNLTLLDIGSAFDPYVGKVTRNYHKKMKVRMPSWSM